MEKNVFSYHCKANQLVSQPINQWIHQGLTGKWPCFTLIWHMYYECHASSGPFKQRKTLQPRNDSINSSDHRTNQLGIWGPLKAGGSLPQRTQQQQQQLWKRCFCFKFYISKVELHWSCCCRWGMLVISPSWRHYCEVNNQGNEWTLFISGEICVMIERHYWYKIGKLNNSNENMLDESPFWILLIWGNIYDLLELSKQLIQTGNWNLEHIVVFIDLAVNNDLLMQ